MTFDNHKKPMDRLVLRINQGFPVTVGPAAVRPHIPVHLLERAGWDFLRQEAGALDSVTGNGGPLLSH